MLLFEANRYARAAALFILAIEEASKPVILADIAASDTDDLRKKHWKRLWSHEAKNYAAATVDLFERRSWHPTRRMPTAEEIEKAPADFDRIKQGALYSEEDGHGGWAVPGDRVTADQARHLAELAQGATSFAKESPLQNDVGMVLWVKHCNPSVGRATPKGRQALRTFRDQAIAAGLCAEDWSSLLDSLPE